MNLISRIKITHSGKILQYPSNIYKSKIEIMNTRTGTKQYQVNKAHLPGIDKWAIVLFAFAK